MRITWAPFFWLAYTGVATFILVKGNTSGDKDLQILAMGLLIAPMLASLFFNIGI